MALRLQEITAPTSEPVTLDEAKKYMRVDLSDDNTEIEKAIKAARGVYQRNIVWRTLVTTVWRQRYDAFPPGDTPIELPLPPLVSIAHIKYYDTTGTIQTWDSGNYDTDVDSEPGRVFPLYGTVWPATREKVGQTVEIQFTAGRALASVDEADKIAIKAMVLEWYDERGETTTRPVHKTRGVERLQRAQSRRRFV